MARARAGVFVGALALFAAAGCGGNDFYDVVVPFDVADIDALDAGMDAAVDGGPGPVPTCGVFAGGVPAWGTLSCGMPACPVEVALDPAHQVPALVWRDCANGVVGCKTLAPPADTTRSWSRIAARYTEQGPFLWLESTESSQLVNTTLEWLLAPAVGPAVAFMRVATMTEVQDGGALAPACSMVAWDVGYANSGIELRDLDHDRAVFLRGANASDPAWQAVFAQTWDPVLTAGGALAATDNEVYLAVLQRSVFRVPGGAQAPEPVDTSFDGRSALAVLQSLPSGVFYPARDEGGQPEIRVLAGGPGVGATVGSLGDAGLTGMFALGASPSTLAWALAPVSNARAYLGHSPLSAQPNGLLPSALLDVGTLDSPTNSATMAVGFGYAMLCEAIKCRVVRLSDGARYAMPTQLYLGSRARALWVGPDEVALADVAAGWNGDYLQNVYRLPLTSLVAIH